LLIVKQTSRRPVDRRVDVDLLLADRLIALDLVVYTPREMWELYWAGSPFIDEVLETGRVLYMRRATGSWLREVREDLDAASILVDHMKHRAACFHGQQAAEKALEALIFEKGGRPPRTHDISELLNLATSEGWHPALSRDDAAFLGRIYHGRYPSEEGLLPHGEPTAEDARRALEAARSLVDSVLAALGEQPA
jgi:HEPN domain-containing protein